MQKPVALSCLIISLAVSTTALADGRKDHEGDRFSVPFFIENALANAPGALRADFTLKHPAILESFQVTCAGAPRGGLLYTDGGPLGVNGTTGVGATSDVGLVVGLFGPILIPTQIDFTVAADGAYFFPPTHLGIPVKANYSFIVFPNAPNGVQCNGEAVFKSLE